MQWHYDANGNEDVKPVNNSFNKQNNNLARAAHFFVHFFAGFAGLRHENTKFRVLWRTSTSNDEILFLSLNLDKVPWNSNSGGFAYIWQSKYVEIP